MSARPASEALRFGLIGATAIWLWLLALDVIAGAPLHTPGILGRDVLGIIVPSVHASPLAGVLAFTLAHYTLWLLLGRLVVRAIAADVRSPGILVGAIVIFILLQLLFAGITQIFNETLLRHHAWPALFGGNVIGFLIAGAYLLRRHPELRAQLRRDGNA
jgi:hypothetical protein